LPARPRSSIDGNSPNAKHVVDIAGNSNSNSNSVAAYNRSSDNDFNDDTKVSALSDCNLASDVATYYYWVFLH
jgi:hypothetical protein